MSSPSHRVDWVKAHRSEHPSLKLTCDAYDRAFPTNPRFTTRSYLSGWAVIDTTTGKMVNHRGDSAAAQELADTMNAPTNPNPAQGAAPSVAAIRAALALNPSEALTLLHPERYAFTVEGKPSTWVDECRAEIRKQACQIDTATRLPELLRLLERAGDLADESDTQSAADWQLAAEIRAELSRQREGGTL